ncbi:MAG: fumarate hydratase [Candidatus Ratteibacteria bacterium]
MRDISENDIIEKIYSAVEKASFSLEPEIMRLLKDAAEKETNPYGKKVLEIIIENIKVAQEKKLPLCQDTGMVLVFFEIGNEVSIQFKNFRSLQEIADHAVRTAYRDFYLRKSIVSVPERKNTQDNSPAVVWCEIVPGNNFKFSLLIKGFGSENTTQLKMFEPAAGLEKIKKFVVDCVKKAGPNPCPPVFVGIGVGGTADKAVYLSKKALFEVGRSERDRFGEFENEIIEGVNKLGIGPGGLGGNFTCLDVRVKSFPTHIAGLPVAVSISCWAHRMYQDTI